VPKPPVIAVGSPCARTIPAAFIEQRDLWLSDNRYYVPTPKLGAQSGRIDLARSYLFEWARDMRPEAAVHLQLDTDVRLLQPLHEMMQIVFEDFELGYDIVIGPTVAMNQRSMTWGFSSKPHSFGPNPIVHGGFGFVAFSPRILRGLKPCYRMTNVDHQELNVYCHNEKDGEDNSFCDNATSQGFRVGCDFRLHVAHAKEILMAPCLPDQAEEVKLRYGKAAQFIIQDIQMMETPPADNPLNPPRPKVEA
jgi:hypothetical protein